MPNAQIKPCEADSCSHVFCKPKFSLWSHQCNFPSMRNPGHAVTQNLFKIYFSKIFQYKRMFALRGFLLDLLVEMLHVFLISLQNLTYCIHTILVDLTTPNRIW
jgi:hypothetical protein